VDAERSDLKAMEEVFHYMCLETAVVHDLLDGQHIDLKEVTVCIRENRKVLAQKMASQKNVDLLDIHWQPS